MRKLMALLQPISDAWKAILALAGAVAFGAAVGIAVHDAVGLPEDVAGLRTIHAADMQELQADLSSVRRLVIDNQQGIREMVDAVNRLVCTMNAEAQGRSTTVCQQIGRDS